MKYNWLKADGKLHEYMAELKEKELIPNTK